MNTTFVIKTLERPEELARLLRSLRGKYPDERVIVADDAKDPFPAMNVCSVFNAEHVAMEHDAGLSAGRNELVSRVDTETFVLMDDDFLVLPGSNIEALVALVSSGLFDLAGGRVLHNGSETDFQGAMHVADNLLVMQKRISRDGCPIDVDICWNFFAARTDAVLRVLWDEELKICEHHDFFLRCKANGCKLYGGRLTRADLHVGFYPGSFINHIPGSNPAYAAYRHQRNAEYWKLVQVKYGITGTRGSLS